MLDAYIIEKIKREQEQSRSERQPIQIPTPRYPDRKPPGWEDREREDESSDRGVVIIDF